MSSTQTEKIGSTLEHLARAMKTPTIARVWEQLAATARDQGWSAHQLHRQLLPTLATRQPDRVFP